MKPSSAGKGAVVLRAFSLPHFVQIVEKAQACFPLAAVRIEVELGGRWFAYVPSLHRACATHLSINKGHLKVAFTAADMGKDDELLDSLGHARQAALELVALIDAEQEQVKARMVDRTADVVDATNKRLADPETPAEVVRALRNTFREPQAILESDQGARQARGRATLNQKVEAQSLAEENHRLRLERKVLKGEALTVDDVAAAPAARAGRRRPR